MLVFLPPLRLWIPLACVPFSCVSTSHFPLLLPLPPLLGINLFSFPSRRSLCLFFPSSHHPVFSFSLHSSSHLPSQTKTSLPTSSSSVYSVFNLPLRLTAESTCVNISAALAHLFVHLVMRLEVCVTDLFHAGGAQLSQLLPRTNLRRCSYMRV